MKKIVAVLLLSSIFVSPVFADNSGKAYVAVDLGASTYVNSVSYPANTNTFRLAAGYQFSPMLAAEIGYIKFGDATYTRSSYSAILTTYSYQAAVVANYPINSQFDLIAKLGVGNSNVREYINVNPGVTLVGPDNYSYTKNSVIFGVGAQYHLNTQFTVRAQYEDYGALTDTSTALKASAFSVGVAYNF